ncbi:MAG TPA: hypothetical protein VN951_08210 [Pyrinomonadaceae bacterium]|nr:hypothetical protein [Pyrinomonadaceae bacterium]
MDAEVWLERALPASGASRRRARLMLCERTAGRKIFGLSTLIGRQAEMAG